MSGIKKSIPYTIEMWKKDIPTLPVFSIHQTGTETLEAIKKFMEEVAQWLEKIPISE